MVKLVWTELATFDLKEIFDYISQNSSRYASRTVGGIYNKAQIIIENPYIGRIVPEINIDNIREVVFGNYRIVYRIVSDSQVDVLRVYHSARLLRLNKIE